MGIRRKIEHLEPTKVPTNIDIAWAAGIWEGEGSCDIRNKRRATVVVTQKDPEILYRLRDWFGGSVVARGGADKCHAWIACGDRGRYFIALIYSFLSTRRRVQVDTSEMLSYLGGRNVEELSYQEIWELLESRPARKRRADAFNETPDEKKSRLAAIARKHYWNHRPQKIEAMRAYKAKRRTSQLDSTNSNEPVRLM
jgi:hypothetical protein